MKSAIAVIALACLATSVVGFVPEECAGKPSTACSSAATLKLLVTDGTCSATASGSCSTWSQSQKVFADQFNEYWTEEEKHCDKGFVAAKATAIATAIVEVWASAAVNINCSDGTGWGCGWSFAGGQSFAVAVAEALAGVAVEAAASKGAESADAYCFADIRALSAVLAQAAAAASVDGCVDGRGGTFNDVKTSYAETVADAVADALAAGSATACIGKTDVVSESVCDGEASSTAKGDVDFSPGSACGGLTKLKACPKGFIDACCSQRRFCRFKGATWRFSKDVWNPPAGGAPCFCT